MADDSKLIPRAYQEEIFSRAQQQNVIAALDTGSGKTYIAALLIRWLASFPSTGRKIHIFIVPRVPLVDQQRIFLEGQLPLTVRGYYGTIVDPWQHDPVRWRREFNECDVMVMTAQVFVDVLSHGHWAISQVALIVFDEAHHANGKNHPYNQIMKDFYKPCPKRQRPRIFGMTASPVWNTKNPLASLQNLEGNLSGKVIGVKENVEELQEHSPRATEIIVKYSLKIGSYDNYHHSLWDRIVALELHSHPTIVQDNVETRYAVTKAELGPYGADYYLQLYLKGLVTRSGHLDPYEYANRLQDAEDRQVLLHLVGPSTSDADAMSVESDDTDASIRIFQMAEALHDFLDITTFNETETIPQEWLSPKLHRLVSVLLENRSADFQGIIFVEQRQVATTLAWILPRIPELRGWIKAGPLIGHSSGSSAKSQGMVDKKQRELLKMFRNRECNLLVSTSVGEEGLDFPACDIIVRYNKLQNLVGYLQSRGRARMFQSVYVIMVSEGEYGDDAELMKYLQFRDNEGRIKSIYQERDQAGEISIEETKELEHEEDIAARERYTTPAGAILTVGSSIALLNNLCSLVPRDKYTKVLLPIYEGDFQVSIRLPSALPVPRDQLVFHGAHRRSKREAKAVAAFAACKALHALGVFDDYLLPAKKTTGEVIEDADGRLIPEVIPNDMLDVLVHDPWCPLTPIGDESAAVQGWIYPILFPNQSYPQLALVAANDWGIQPSLPLDHAELTFGCPQAIRISAQWLEVLRRFTALGIHWCNTSKLIRHPLTCFLAIMNNNGSLDFNQMDALVKMPLQPALNRIAYQDEGRLLVQSKFEYGRPLLLRRLREDLSLFSRPCLADGASSEGEFNTYLELFEKEYSSKKYPARIPEDGPLLEVEKFSRNFSSQYRLYPKPDSRASTDDPVVRKRKLVPASVCDVLVLPDVVLKGFHALPQIVRRVTDVYRARSAIRLLSLPPLIEDYVVEAFTLPCATAPFNNQRLETLGDSILKLCVVVYVYNKFPHRHEGQLDSLRGNSVSNRTLLARAREVGLEQFLTSEPSDVRKWRPTEGDGLFFDEVWYAQRTFARRSLQDCMEALLGVSFLSGGISMALRTGTALRLCFGGETPWSERYEKVSPTLVPPLFEPLEKELGYKFKSGQLLVEAFTHPSFTSNNACYQRLEFLGDALIDVVILEYLFKKFPYATSGQLTWAKSRAVWAPALTTIAVKRLSLQKYLLVSNVELQKAIGQSVEEHSSISYEKIVLEGWKYEPPKALSDVAESLCGAMLVDSGYNYEEVRLVVERLLEPLLDVLHPNIPKDPTSELLLSLAKKGCERAKFERFQTEKAVGNQNDAVRFLFHDRVIGGPMVTGKGRGIARLKPILAEQVKEYLDGEGSHVRDICNCASSRIAKQQLMEKTLKEVEPEELDDEKEEQFAVLGLLALESIQETPTIHVDEFSDDEDEMEVG